MKLDLVRALHKCMMHIAPAVTSCMHTDKFNKTGVGDAHIAIYVYVMKWTFCETLPEALLRQQQ